MTARRWQIVCLASLGTMIGVSAVWALGAAVALPVAIRDVMSEPPTSPAS